MVLQYRSLGLEADGKLMPGLEGRPEEGGYGRTSGPPFVQFFRDYRHVTQSAGYVSRVCRFGALFPAVGRDGFG